MKREKPVILRNAGTETPSLWFYSEFGSDDYYNGCVSANAVRYALDSLGTVRKLEVHINSEGGDVFEAGAIYNLLKNCGAKVIMFIDGMAVSCASWVAQAGDEIHMAENALMMIHNPEADCYGGEDDMERMRQTLVTAKKAILSIYSKRSTKSTPDQLSAAMSAETWYSAEEALDAGLVDLIDENKSVPMTNRRRFRNAPARLREIEPQSDDYRRVINQRKLLLNELENLAV